MSAVHEVVILANSIKQGNRCVAGKNIRTKEWIRPVSTEEGGALSNQQARISNKYGTYGVKPLQKAYIEFSLEVPLASQPENLLIANNKPWEQHFKLNRGQLYHYADTPEHIWDYGYAQDRVGSEYFQSENSNDHQSLYLIKVSSITFKVVPGSQGYKKLVGSFEYNQKQYTFSVTDPEYCCYKNNELGYMHTEHDKFLCLSLTDEFHGFSYKLIASIL